MKVLLAVVLVGCGGAALVPDRVVSGEIDRVPLKRPFQRGRVWIAASGSPIVFELVTADGEPVGVVAEVDGDRVQAMRVYNDPLHAHPPSHVPFEGTAVVRGTADQALVAIANQSWAGMNAHSGAQTMASAAATYTLDDFAAPKVLDRAGTEAMVDGFLHAVGDFHVTSRVQFAAGNDVISENVETMTLNGKPITLHALDIKRIEGGRVVKEWQYANGAELGSQ